MKRIDWHSGFVSAMKLELIENENDLDYDEEHYIANRAQRIDLLIIKNDNKAIIHNPIGTMFSRFNICEYKSPEDSLTYGDFYKTLAYTSLYLNETAIRDKYHANDYTMTFVREPHPYSLFRRLRADGIEISPVLQGIYELKNNLPFRTQVIITKEIPEEYGSWLKCLTRHGNEANLRDIVISTPALKAHNKQHADNIMNIFTVANRNLVSQKIKEEPSMCQAVDELFAEVFADEIKEMKASIADKDSQIAVMGSQIADMSSQIANKDVIIAELQAKLKQLNASKT